jgi:hypothetical protein
MARNGGAKKIAVNGVYLISVLRLEHFDLISDALPFGRLWYGEPDAVGNGVARRNQITRKLARSKFANWILCFCHIRLLAMGRFN